MNEKLLQNTTEQPQNELETLLEMAFSQSPSSPESEEQQFSQEISPESKESPTSQLFDLLNQFIDDYSPTHLPQDDDFQPSAIEMITSTTESLERLIEERHRIWHQSGRNIEPVEDKSWNILKELKETIKLFPQEFIKPTALAEAYRYWTTPSLETMISHPFINIPQYVLQKVGVLPEKKIGVGGAFLPEEKPNWIEKVLIDIGKRGYHTALMRGVLANLPASYKLGLMDAFDCPDYLDTKIFEGLTHLIGFGIKLRVIGQALRGVGKLSGASEIAAKIYAQIGKKFPLGSQMLHSAGLMATAGAIDRLTNYGVGAVFVPQGIAADTLFGAYFPTTLMIPKGYRVPVMFMTGVLLHNLTHEPRELLNLNKDAIAEGLVLSTFDLIFSPKSSLFVDLTNTRKFINKLALTIGKTPEEVQSLRNEYDKYIGNIIYDIFTNKNATLKQKVGHQKLSLREILDRLEDPLISTEIENTLRAVSSDTPELIVTYTKFAEKLFDGLVRSGKIAEKTYDEALTEIAEALSQHGSKYSLDAIKTRLNRLTFLFERTQNWDSITPARKEALVQATIASLIKDPSFNLLHSRYVNSAEVGQKIGKEIIRETIYTEILQKLLRLKSSEISAGIDEVVVKMFKEGKVSKGKWDKLNDAEKLLVLNNITSLDLKKTNIFSTIPPKQNNYRIATIQALHSMLQNINAHLILGDYIPTANYKKLEFLLNLKPEELETIVRFKLEKGKIPKQVKDLQSLLSELDITDLLEAERSTEFESPKRVITKLPENYVKTAEAIPPETRQIYGINAEQELYHVTTAKNKVYEEGLKPRKETDMEGLGGGYKNIAPDKISLTYSEEKASIIKEDLILAVKAAKHQVKPSDILKHFGKRIGDISFDENLFRELGYLKGSKEAKNLEKLYQKIDKDYQGKEYEFYKITEEFAMKYLDETLLPEQITGITASKEKLAQIDPEQIDIVKVAVRKDSKLDIIPDELEIRVNPEDVLVINPVSEVMPEESSSLHSIYQHKPAISRFHRFIANKIAVLDNYLKEYGNRFDLVELREVIDTLAQLEYLVTPLAEAPLSSFIHPKMLEMINTLKTFYKAYWGIEIPVNKHALLNAIHKIEERLGVSLTFSKETRGEPLDIDQRAELIIESPEIKALIEKEGIKLYTGEQFPLSLLREAIHIAQNRLYRNFSILSLLETAEKCFPFIWDTFGTTFLDPSVVDYGSKKSNYYEILKKIKSDPTNISTTDLAYLFHYLKVSLIQNSHRLDKVYKILDSFISKCGPALNHYDRARWREFLDYVKEFKTLARSYWIEWLPPEEVLNKDIIETLKMYQKEGRKKEYEELGFRYPLEKKHVEGQDTAFDYIKIHILEDPSMINGNITPNSAQLGEFFAKLSRMRALEETPYGRAKSGRGQEWQYTFDELIRTLKMAKALPPTYINHFFTSMRLVMDGLGLHPLIDQGIIANEMARQYFSMKAYTILDNLFDKPAEIKLVDKLPALAILWLNRGKGLVDPVSGEFYWRKSNLLQSIQMIKNLKQISKIVREFAGGKFKNVSMEPYYSELSYEQYLELLNYFKPYEKLPSHLKQLTRRLFLMQDMLTLPDRFLEALHEAINRKNFGLKELQLIYESGLKKKFGGKSLVYHWLQKQEPLTEVDFIKAIKTAYGFREIYRELGKLTNLSFEQFRDGYVPLIHQLFKEFKTTSLNDIPIKRIPRSYRAFFEMHRRMGSDMETFFSLNPLEQLGFYMQQVLRVRYMKTIEERYQSLKGVLPPEQFDAIGDVMDYMFGVRGPARREFSASTKKMLRDLSKIPVLGGLFNSISNSSIDKFFTALRDLIYVQFLGFSVGNMFQNASQVLLNTSEFGYKNFFKYHKKAFSKEMLTEIWKEGIISDWLDFFSTSGIQNLSKHTLMSHALALMSASDIYTRVVTYSIAKHSFLDAVKDGKIYELLRRFGGEARKDVWKLVTDALEKQDYITAAKQFAKQAVYDLQFAYGGHHSPKAFKSEALKLALVFSTWPLYRFELTKKWWKNRNIGAIARNFMNAMALQAVESSTGLPTGMWYMNPMLGGIEPLLGLQATPYRLPMVLQMVDNAIDYLNQDDNAKRALLEQVVPLLTPGGYTGYRLLKMLGALPRNRWEQKYDTKDWLLYLLRLNPMADYRKRQSILQDFLQRITPPKEKAPRPTKPVSPYSSQDWFDRREQKISRDLFKDSLD